MRLRPYLSAVTILCAACTPSRPAQLTDRELALSRSAGFQDSITQLIRNEARGELNGLFPLDSTGSLLPARGLLFGAKQAQVAGTMRRLRRALGPAYLVFEADRGFGFRPDSIGVLLSRDPLDMLRVRSTNGANYEIDTDSIIARVRAWTDTLGFELTAASGDWLEGRFSSRQPDWRALARELYAFCPDIVDQGTDTVEALEAELRRTRTLYCWWD